MLFLNHIPNNQCNNELFLNRQSI